MNKHEVTQCEYFTGVGYSVIKKPQVEKSQYLWCFLSRRGKTEKIYKIWR